MYTVDLWLSFVSPYIIDNLVIHERQQAIIAIHAAAFVLPNAKPSPHITYWFYCQRPELWENCAHRHQTHTRVACQKASSNHRTAPHALKWQNKHLNIDYRPDFALNMALALEIPFGGCVHASSGSLRATAHAAREVAVATAPPLLCQCCSWFQFDCDRPRHVVIVFPQYLSNPKLIQNPCDASHTSLWIANIRDSMVDERMREK